MVLVLYAADRALKARAQVRRLRSMSDRLAAATARAEQQEERRQAVARASEQLTSVLPAIKRPPLTGPGMRSHPAARRGAGHTPPRGRGAPAHPPRRTAFT